MKYSARSPGMGYKTMTYSMHHRRHIGLGPANIVRGVIFTLAVDVITGSLGSSITFLVFYLAYTVCGQLLGLENME